MASRDGQEEGIRSPFTLRVGLDVPKFRGENRQNDPASIGDEQFQNLINVRLDGTAIRPRPGLASLLTTPMSNCIVGIFDDENPTSGTALYFG